MFLVMDTAVHQEEKAVIGSWIMQPLTNCPAVRLLMSFLIRGLYSPTLEISQN